MVTGQKHWSACTLAVAGDDYPAVGECSFCLSLTNSTLLKMGDQPRKLPEAFRYFLWGTGYILSSIMSRLTAFWIYLISHNAGCIECPISWPVTTNQLRIQDSPECTNALDRHQLGEVSCWTGAPPWSHISPSFRWTRKHSIPISHSSMATKPFSARLSLAFSAHILLLYILRTTFMPLP